MLSSVVADGRLPSSDAFLHCTRSVLKEQACVETRLLSPLTLGTRQSLMWETDGSHTVAIPDCRLELLEPLGFQLARLAEEGDSKARKCRLGVEAL